MAGKKVGAGWRKTIRDGLEIINLSLDQLGPGDGTRFTVWPTKEKRHEKSPDYYVTVDDYKPGDKPATRPAPDMNRDQVTRPDMVRNPTDPTDDPDGIPF
jgi:hypothetical protein